MPLLKTTTHTIDDIYALPDGQRAELIDGQIYNMAPPSPLHQELVALFTTELQNYISKKHGNCKVYPAPFAVFIKDDDSNYVEPDISIVCDSNKISHRGCEGHLTLSSKSFHQAAVKWIILQKMHFMPMQVFGSIGLWILPENAQRYTDMRKMSRR